MQWIFSLLFKAPPMPPIGLPLPVRMIPGVRQAIADAFQLAYQRGIYDGFVAGVLVSLLFLPSIRKGAANVLSHF